MLPVTSVVVGPTSFGTIVVVPGDEGVVHRNTPQEGMTFAMRHYERGGDIGGSNPPDLITSSTVDNIAGPLGFTYGQYAVVTQPADAWELIEAAPEPSEIPSWPAPQADQFTSATLNTENFDNPSLPELDKIAEAVDQMNGPTILALQEVDEPAVMGTLIAELNNDGYAYGYAGSPPDAGNHGIVLMWRSDAVSNVTWSTGYQGCSEVGSTSSTSDPLWDYCRSLGQYPLFSQRPVVMTGTVSLGATNQEIVVIAGHFKSKLGGVPADQKRLEQAEFVAALTNNFLANTTPYVIVLGDLNDYEDSPPLEALYNDANLQSTWFSLPAEERWSFIFRGVSQVLDHILVTPAMSNWLEDVGVMRFNADFPYLPYTFQGTNIWRYSDHDPVIATFTRSDNLLYLPAIQYP